MIKNDNALNGSMLVIQSCSIDCLQMAVQLKTKEVPSGKGLGVFYWEPEGASSWSHYALSCWGSNGLPTMALDAFLH